MTNHRLRIFMCGIWFDILDKKLCLIATFASSNSLWNDGWKSSSVWFFEFRVITTLYENKYLAWRNMEMRLLNFNQTFRYSNVIFVEKKNPHLNIENHCFCHLGYYENAPSTNPKLELTYRKHHINRQCHLHLGLTPWWLETRREMFFNQLIDSRGWFLWGSQGLQWPNWELRRGKYVRFMEIVTKEKVIYLS